MPAYIPPRVSRTARWALGLDRPRGALTSNWWGFTVVGPGAQAGKHSTYAAGSGARMGWGGRAFLAPDPQSPYWIPSHQRIHGGAASDVAGRWGTRQEFKAAKKAIKGQASQAGVGLTEVRGGRYLRSISVAKGGAIFSAIATPFIIGGKMKSGQGFLEAAGSTIAEEIVGYAAFRAAGALITHPAGWVAMAGVGAFMAYRWYRNKMAAHYDTARQTEMYGSMYAFNTRQAHTMRQRSMQAIQRSYLNARKALGNEAKFHMLPASRSAMQPPMMRP